MSSEYPKICHCPFYYRCHEDRQRLQLYYQVEDSNYKVKDCMFYKAIKEINTREGKSYEDTWLS